jgi:hypothetical protein
MKELQMKFSDKTVNLLKNFSTINPGLFFKQGNTISTMSPQKNILCEAVVEDTFPQDFGIHDLNNFLSVLSLNKDPDVEFDGKNAIIKYLNGRSKIKYRFTEASMIVSPPEKKITLPSVDVTFSLSEEDYAWIQKTASILRSPNVAVVGDNETVSLVTFDSVDDSAATNTIDIGLTTDKKFKLIFKTENLKMVPGAYTVDISSKGIAHFKNTKETIQYWIATESGSTFEE